MKDDYPKKIYVELTTRCNLSCRKCVKYAEGSNIVERNMPLTVFKKLLPACAYADTLVLNGIGEPLLHPHLLEIIGLARASMPKNATIGFQSNGFLLDAERCRNLIGAGLDTMCLSLDGLQKSTDTIEPRGEHSFLAVSEAVSNLVRARRMTAGNFRIGLEIVLKKDTIQDLPALVSWAADNGVDYILTTHLILYDKASENDTLFDPNSMEARQLFQKYDRMALSKGMDLADCFSLYRKYAGTRSDDAARQIFEDMQSEAREKEIRLNIRSLLSHGKRRSEVSETFFHEARALAEARGIDLYLPPLQARDQRSCPFMADRTTFVAANGDVMPCHFLWHTYSCRLLEEEIAVRERVFGNVSRDPLETIWQERGYAEFRKEAGLYEYSSCWSCPLAPCPSLVNDNVCNLHDCYGSQVPCGHCQWNLGGIRCL